MSTNNLSSVLKSCSESELINEVTDNNMTPKQVEGSRLKRTFTLPRNPLERRSLVQARLKVMTATVSKQVLVVQSQSLQRKMVVSRGSCLEGHHGNDF